MRTDCAVVGAGPAGLAMSEALVGRGVDHVVLEAGEVASTWSAQRWDSFMLNTPAWMNEMLGPLRADSYCTRDEVVERLTAKAARLPVRTQSRVHELAADGSDFVLRTSDGDVRARAVVLASGLQNRPVRPACAEGLPARVAQLHAGDYRSAAGLPEGAVLVVGGGQSGAQIAEDLARAGRRVYLSTARVARINWTYRGVETFRRLDRIGYWDQRPEDLEDPALTRLTQPLVASGGRSLNLRLLADLGVTLLGHLRSADGERLTLDDSLRSNVAFGDAFWARVRSLVDSNIVESGEPAAEPEPDPGEGGTIADPPESLDLAECDVGTVLWCTGFGGDLSWVRLPILDGREDPLHQGTASAVPGVWFVGFPWLSRRRSGILYGFPVDAAETAEAVVEHLGSRVPG